MKHQIIFENTSQTLVHVPPGYVSSATYKIELLTVSLTNADRVIASGSATVDTATETITAAAGPAQVDSRKLTMADTTGFSVGKRYAVVDGTTGTEEIAEVFVVKTNSYLLTKHPLTRDYAIGSTVKGMQLSASFPDASAAVEEYLEGEYPMRVVWEYTLAGTVYVVQDQIELVRFSHGDFDLARCVLDMQDAWPTINARLEHKSGNALMQAAEFGLRRIHAGLKAKNIDPLTFHTGEQGRWCLMWSAFKHLAQFGISPANMTLMEFKEDCENEYSSAFNSMTIGYPGRDVVEIDHDTDVALPKDRTLGTYRTVILSS